MKRIRKFESFSTHRLPTKVSYDEWFKKLNMCSKEPFTQKEIDFFSKLVEENNFDIDSYSVDKPSTINLIMDYYWNYEDIVVFEFIKLSDQWYLISDHSHDKFYICDEWDEVLGYLESKNLKF
jgi:hypothetical protein